jgi:TatA/E family protein of Tat protein translocase
MGIESPTHLIFIAVVALIVLGPKRLPDLARALGQGIREFRQSLDEGADPPEGATAPVQTVTPAASASSATPAPAPPETSAVSTAPVAPSPSPAQSSAVSTAPAAPAPAPSPAEGERARD